MSESTKKLLFIAAVVGLLALVTKWPVTPVTVPVVVQPAPIAEPGLRVLVIADASQDIKLAPAQLSALNSNRVPAYVATKGGKFAMYDVTALDAIKDTWAATAAKRPRISTPWAIVSNAPKGGYEGPLPADDPAWFALVQSWGEK